MKARRHPVRTWSLAAVVAPLALLASHPAGPPLAATVGPEPPAAASLSWPLGTDGSPRSLYSTHGQFWFLQKDRPYLHQGIDISACPGEPVYAVESGTVVASTCRPGSSYQYQTLIISRGADFANGIKYMHLGSSTVNIGDKVEAKTMIGTVIDWQVFCSYDHLHLARVTNTAGPSTVWISAFADDAGNPLSLFDCSEDKDAPFGRPLASGPASGEVDILFFENGSTTELDPSKLSGEIDIVASVHDLCFPKQPACSSSVSACTDKPSFEVAPFKLQVTIDGPLGVAAVEAAAGTAAGEPQAFESIQFEGPVSTGLACDLAAAYYDAKKSVGWYTSRDFRFVLTHGTANAADAWKPNDGAYNVTVEAVDRNSNRVVLQALGVTVGP
jgi:Peptidase family M23